MNRLIRLTSMIYAFLNYTPITTIKYADCFKINVYEEDPDKPKIALTNPEAAKLMALKQYFLT